jgi:hypothetical protein
MRSFKGCRSARGGRFVHVADFGGEGAGPFVPEQAPVVLEVRAAAGGVDDDGVHLELFEAADESASEGE